MVDYTRPRVSPSERAPQVPQTESRSAVVARLISGATPRAQVGFARLQNEIAVLDRLPDDEAVVALFPGRSCLLAATARRLLSLNGRAVESMPYDELMHGEYLPISGLDDGLWNRFVSRSGMFHATGANSKVGSYHYHCYWSKLEAEGDEFAGVLRNYINATALAG